MIDNNLPDLIKNASDAVQANLPETAKETDGALSTVVGFFNNVVLYPLKKANISFKYKLEEFQADLERKVIDVPNECLQKPPLMIAGPTLEALKYAYDEPELREMFENLLAASMDCRNNEKVRPSYVDTIRQLSPLDAKVLEIIAHKRQIACVSIQFCIADSKQYYLYGMPDYFALEFTELGDQFAVSASIINLMRLGIIDIVKRVSFDDVDYSTIYNHPFVESQFEEFSNQGRKITKETVNMAISLNNYGQSFVTICLPEKGESDVD